MSNIIAGDIFQKIIEEVVAASQTDFEENGVNQQTLTELQQTWQQKLSARNVAQMPWDPKPQPPPSVNQSAGSSQANTPVSAYPAGNQHQNDGHIKREPGLEAPYNGVPGSQGYMHQAMNPQLAQQRAASLLQQQFGSQANASLGAMQQRGISLPGQQQQQPSQQQPQQKGPGGLQLPGQNPQAMQQQYAQSMKQHMVSQQPRIKTEDGQSENNQYQQQHQNLGYAQTDGAGDALDDWQNVMSATRSLSDEQIAENDRLISNHVAQGARDLDGGLMVPLEQRKAARATKRPVRRGTIAEGIPQLDGEFDDDDKDGIKDEDDEDAINSDLDDDDEDPTNADDDDDEIDSMLCTYDKVQRVKNKWKCVLKDGVLSANGKEYLFHKAQGEFEW